MKLFCIRKNYLNLIFLQTGLTKACRESTMSIEQAEKELIEYLKKNEIKYKECPLAGNTIYMDRLFLREYMPIVNDFLHYRLIDVSTCKELCKRWNSKIFNQAPTKKLRHRGFDDIMESINELKYYKKFMFNKEKV